MSFLHLPNEITMESPNFSGTQLGRIRRHTPQRAGLDATPPRGAQRPAGRRGLTPPMLGRKHQLPDREHPLATYMPGSAPRERLLVNAAGESCQTALLATILEGKQGLVILLLADQRIDINHRNRWGVGPPSPCLRTEVNVRDEWQRTPLFSVVAEKQIQAARILAADARVNVNVIGEFGHEHQHPLAVAAEERFWEVVEMLLQGEDVDFSALNCKASSPEDLEKIYGAATARGDPVGLVV
ncbi:hypothetical protein HOY82DRAFT_617451 [Tuber indicum]|nr:hypothetical protein HOY82DRAFT_617451 [Tuber indicum]